MVPTALALLLSTQNAPVWIEGENPSRSTPKIQTGAWGRKEVLSGEDWARFDLPLAESKEPPTVAYDFEAGGKREVWARVGYEFVRSPFSWRLDKGPWRDVSPDQPTTDLQAIADWSEIAWLKIGDADLAPGTHTIEFRVVPRLNDKGEPDRYLFALDALLLSPGPFRPNGRAKPGEDRLSDRDRAAAANVFALPAGEGRAKVALQGDWEIARADEVLPTDPGVPMTGPPPDGDDPRYWSAIAVPGDKNALRPDLVFAHRVWYRTRVDVPKEAAGRSFSLAFPSNCLDTTVVVNGQTCGFNPSPHAGFRVDVSRAIRPGKNTVLVGIRDAWYAYSGNPKDPMKRKRRFNIPLSFTYGGFQDFAYPVWRAMQSGILDAPTLESAGPVYAEDTFVRPLVSKGRLAADVTLRNPGDASRTVEVALSANGVAVGTARAEVPAGGTVLATVEGSGKDLPLWWPDSPRMLDAKVEVKENGAVLDASTTPFGYREWTNEGPVTKLNGVPWRMWGELVGGDTPEAFAREYRAKNQRLFRLAGTAQNGGTRWKGLTFDGALDFADREGLVVRRSNVLDGEAIGYMAVENDPDLRAKYGTDIKRELMDNWKRQLAQQVRWERNHPSIHVWSVENEWLYINVINLYGDKMDEFERVVAEVGKEAVEANDPTRLWMTDGGGAGKANLFPVHGDHYVYTNRPSDYPARASEAQPDGAGRGRWTWDGKRPRYAGEDFFATGINPPDYAWIGGERAFEGKVGAWEGIARVQRMLQQGYREGGAWTAWHLWVGDEGAAYGKYVPNAERAAWLAGFGRTLKPGDNPREVVVANDARTPDPAELRWTLQVGGKEVGKGGFAAPVPMGATARFPVILPAPKVAARTVGTLTLSLESGGKTVFTDAQPVAVLPEPGAFPKVAVYDPAGRLKAVPGPRVTALGAIPAGVKTLLVAPDALTAEEATAPTLAAWAASTGGRAVVLEQKEPLRYAALPSDLAPSDGRGAFAFPEIPGHPALRGIEEPDLYDTLGYLRAYRKGSKGARSVVQCDERLGSTALAEVPVGEGMLLLCQLRVGEKLGTDVVARTLLRNLLTYADGYRPVRRPVAAALTGDPSLAGALASVGLNPADAGSPVAALAAAKNGVALVSATPDHLKALADSPALAAFLKGGGTLFLHGLTAEGLGVFGRITGVPSLLRPSRQERITIARPRSPLAAGLSLRDVSMTNGVRMFDWVSDEFAADDVFTSVIELDDAAPFGVPAGFENTVNGLVSSDSWKYVYSFDLKGAKPEVEYRLPESRRFTGLEWTGNGFYHLVTKIELEFDGGVKRTYDVAPNTDPQPLKIEPPVESKAVRLRIVEWQRRPETGQDVVGIDHLRLFTDRGAAYAERVRPVLNLGGIVEYRVGGGNVVLCNLNFREREATAENGTKKRAILATLLRNLGVGMTEARTVVPGARGLEYAPVDVAPAANAFRNEKGWFGDAARSFRAFPAGDQTFGDVRFRVYDFPTSPVPTAVMVGGEGKPDASADVPVNLKTPALFLLHAMRVDRRDGEIGPAARYVVVYADGQRVEIPVRPGIEVDDYRQTDPKALPGARVGWSAPFAEGSAERGTAYLLQWNNPRPDAEIRAIRLEAGPDRRGPVALLAVSAVR